MTRKLANILFIIFVAGFALAPTVQMLRQGEINIDENRNPYPLPELKAHRRYLENFPKGFDLYLADHIGFRQQLIDTQHYIEGTIFDQSTNDTVWIGAEGWLYLNVADRNAGKPGALPPATMVARWIDELAARAQWCAERNIKYYLVITPEKSMIYPEHLPAYHQRHPPPDTITMAEPLLRERGVTLIPAREAVLAGKRDGTEAVFLVKDTHWTYHGSRLAYEKLTEVIAKDFPGFQALPRDHYRREWMDFEGDLALNLGWDAEQRIEKQKVYLATVPGIREVDVAPLLKRLSPDVTILASAKPNCFQLASASGPYVIVLRDSFANNWVPFLQSDFRNVLMIPTYDFPTQVIVDQQPAIVIQEMTARTLIFSPIRPIAAASK